MTTCARAKPSSAIAHNHYCERDGKKCLHHLGVDEGSCPANDQIFCAKGAGSGNPQYVTVSAAKICKNMQIV
jgi:hypothetical protein